MHASNTTPFPSTLRMRLRRICFENWILIAGISVVVGVGTFKILDAHERDQYRAERAPVISEATPRIEAIFRAWTTITPGLDIDRSHPSVLKWDGASSKIIGIVHVPSNDIERFLFETEHMPDRWIVYAQSASGRFFSLTASWDYETRSPVFDEGPRTLTKLEMIQIGIKMNWVEEMKAIGVVVENA